MSKVLVPVLLLVVSAGLAFSYIKPAYENLQEFELQEAELVDAIDEAKKLVEGYQILLRDKSSISEEDRRNLEKILPDAVDVIQLIVDIDVLTRENNLEIESFDIPYVDREASMRTSASASKSGIKTQTGDPVGNAMLTIGMKGSYEDFKEFLYDVERSMMLVDVVELRVQSSTGKNKDGTVYDVIKYEVGLQAYWLKAE